MDKVNEVHVVKEEVNEVESVILEQEEGGYDLSLTEQKEEVEEIVMVEQQRIWRR